jgi:anti-sigma-K factor RskA
MSDSLEEIWLRAGEYVLGLLDAGEMSAIRQEAETSPQLANAIAFWEQRLLPLTDLVPAVAPPADLFARIEARLVARAGAAAPTAEILPFKPRNGSVRRWQTIAVVAMATAAGLAFVLLTSVPPAPVKLAQVAPAPSPAAAPSVVAVLLPQAGVTPTTGWVALKGADGAVRMTAFGTIGNTPEKYLELWAVPKGGSPVPLGQIPNTAKNARFALKGDLSTVLALAVSQEPSNQPLKGPTTIQYVGAVVD